MKRVGKSKIVDKSSSTDRGKSTSRGAAARKYTLAGKGKPTGKFASAGAKKATDKFASSDKVGASEKFASKEKNKSTGKFASTGRGKSTEKPAFAERSSTGGKFKSAGKGRAFGKTSRVESDFSDASDKNYAAKRKTADSAPKPKSREPKLSDSMRLNRFLANAGICSRREADKYIESGIVTINGKVVTELGTKVLFNDVVKFNDAPLAQEKKTYILLNKPKDYVTTLDDPHAKKTVLDLISNGCKERVYPVGRLDKATTGLLLLTNDGDLAEFLSHPRNNKKKIYQATLDKAATLADLQSLSDGVTLEDGMVKADEISYVDPADKTVIGIEIHSGKNRVVRRMFEHVGYDVKKLDRVYYAGLTKKNLPRGKWRFLSEKEIVMLKRGIFA